MVLQAQRFYYDLGFDKPIAWCSADYRTGSVIVISISNTTSKFGRNKAENIRAEEPAINPL